MTGARLTDGTTPHASRPAEPKRRKVRKGTQSCWACKRKKIRCSFRTPTDTVCDGCRARGTACISQELPESPAPAIANANQVGVRLGRMESVVNQLVKQVDNNGAAQPSIDHRVHDGPKNGSSHQSISSSASFAAHNARNVTLAECQYGEMGADSDALACELLCAWPSSHDLDLITSGCIDTSIIFHGLICAPYETFLSQGEPSLRQILRPPSPKSHPILVARKLLILGTLLQGVSRPAPSGLAGLSIGHRDIMSRAVEAAIRLVTSNEELIGCVEGLECVMIESMYHNNAGNLRRSLLALRRATMLAQMMGLHRKASWSSVRILEPETRTRVSLEHLWYRLIQSDRYLSLMLGLPPGVVEDEFARPEVLKNCTPLERMERLQSVAGGHILQWKGADLHDPAQLHEIDKLLRSAAGLMPAQWWLIPEIVPSPGDPSATLRETIRLMDQFSHYNILLHLHLPYLLRPSADGRYDYSKMTAVTASRELLARFVSFRDGSPTTAYCRGIDFLAFTASTVLCLAHIDAARRAEKTTSNEQRSGGRVFSLLTHQRLSDRGLMERALGCLKLMADGGVDLLASKIAGILGHLLVIEEDATNGGGSYQSSSVPEAGENDELGCSGQVLDGGSVLHISIPYFGTIKIERSGLSKTNAEPIMSATLQQHQQQDDDDCNLRAGYRIGMHSSNPDWQPVPSHYGNSAQHQSGDSVTARRDELLEGPGFNSAQDMQLLVPGLAASVDDWALQGVDMALFDTLLCGTGTDLADDASWTL